MCRQARCHGAAQANSPHVTGLPQPQVSHPQLIPWPSPNASDLHLHGLSRSNTPKSVFVFLFPHHTLWLAISLTSFFQPLPVELIPKPWSGNWWLWQIPDFDFVNPLPPKNQPSHAFPAAQLSCCYPLSPLCNSASGRICEPHHRGNSAHQHPPGARWHLQVL